MGGSLQHERAFLVEKPALCGFFFLEVLVDKKSEIKLDEIFSTYQKKVDRALDVRSEKQILEETFLKDFLEIRGEMIKPLFENFALAVENKGVKCRVDTLEEQTRSDLRAQAANITITFLIGDERRRELREYPHLSVLCEKREQLVRINVSTIGPNRGGQSGAIGKFPLSQMNPDFLLEKLLDLLQKVLL